MNETKRLMRKNIRKDLEKLGNNGVMSELLNVKDYFNLHTNQLWYLDKMRTAMVNQTRSAIVEKIIKKSKLYPKIVTMRRDQKVDKKETAKLIKKALKERGWTEDMVTKERDMLLDMDKSYHALDIAKAELKKKLKVYLITQPIFVNWIDQIRGVDVLTASKLLRIVGDITRFDKPSSLWHYFGFHVVDGKAPKKKRGQQATWNPKANAVAFLIGQSQKMSRGPYRKYYDEYKKRDVLKHPDYAPFYRDKRAIRATAKKFLLEFWLASYKALGLEPPRRPYSSRFHPNEEYQPIVPYPQ